MAWMRLRIARRAIAVAVFCLAALPFLDLHGRLPDALGDALYWTQVVPSLIRLSEALGWAAAGCLLVLALTLVFGRVYCSTLCPLGTLQDLVSRLARRRRSRHGLRFRYERPRNGLRFGLLAAVVAAALAGSLALVVLLDPFSIFARGMALLVRPVLVVANNLAGRALEAQGAYLLGPVEGVSPLGIAFVVSLAVLAVVVIMAARHGRRFCNTLCPVGTALGLISRLSLYRIRIDQERCTTCAHCAVACRAGCIDLKRKRVDFDRCVGCLDCIPVCSESGIGYVPVWAGGEVSATDPGRRALLAGALAWSAGLRPSPPRADEPNVPTNREPTRVPIKRAAAVSPPGTLSAERFSQTCTACYLCVSACPTQVIQPALLAYQGGGLLQPAMDYSAAYCTYECIRCGQVCPTGAIRAFSASEKKATRIGLVHFIEDNCVVVTDRTDCGACAEHCPTKAVRMVPYENDLTIPVLDTDVCVGCGACEFACPVRPHKAIYVDGEPEHLAAAPPRASAPPSAAGAGGDADFPF